MIPNEEKRELSDTLATRTKLEGREANISVRKHYLAIKKLSALLKGITSNNNGDFYCLNCLLFLGQKTNLNRIK